MKSLTFVALLIVFGAWSASAQIVSTPNDNKKSKKNLLDYRTAIVVYPFAALYDNFRVGIEHRPNPKIGLRGIFLYGYGENNVFYSGAQNNNNYEYSSFGGEFQMRYYPIPTNPALYTGFFAGGRNIDVSRDEFYTDPNTYVTYTTNKKYSAGQFNFGVLGGLQGTIARVFVVDAYLGMGPNIVSGSYRLPPASNNNNNGGVFNGNNSTTYIAPGMRKGMKYNLGFDLGVVLFK